jgi:NitT/TauT family transport system permease protein
MTGQAHVMTPRGQPTTARFSVRIPNERLFYALLGLGGLLIAWQLASNAGLIKKILMSSPIDIANTAITDFTTGAIWPHLTISAQEWILGLLIAIVIGIPFGFALGYFRRLRLFSNYWLFAVDATPSVALFPLIVLVLGIGLESKIFMVFLACIFQITLSTMQGVRSVSWKHEEIANSFRASTWQRVRSVVLPSTIPFALTGLRLGASRALVGVVTAEFLAANQGLGYYIALNGQTLNTSRVFVGLLMLGIFGILIGELVRVVEHRFDVWRPAIHR